MNIESGDYQGFDTALDEAGVLTITFNRPEAMNAATVGMKRDLVEVLTQCQMEDGVRVVVFTGTGRSVSYTHLTLPTKRIV